MLFEFAVEHLLKEKQAANLISPYKAELVAIWRDAWKIFTGIPEEVRHRIEESGIVKAGCLNTIAGSLVKERFKGRRMRAWRFARSYSL